MLHRRSDRRFVAEVIPPRVPDPEFAGMRAALAALPDARGWLEMVIARTGPRWYVAAQSEPALAAALDQVLAAYPQAGIEPLDPARPDLDPGCVLAGERTAAVVLRAPRETALPLHADWRHEADPLTGVLAAAQPRGNERIVCRLALGPAPGHAARADRPPRGSRTTLARERLRVRPGTESRPDRRRDGGRPRRPAGLALVPRGSVAPAARRWRRRVRGRAAGRRDGTSPAAPPGAAGGAHGRGEARGAAVPRPPRGDRRRRSHGDRLRGFALCASRLPPRTQPSTTPRAADCARAARAEPSSRCC